MAGGGSPRPRTFLGSCMGPELVTGGAGAGWGGAGRWAPGCERGAGVGGDRRGLPVAWGERGGGLCPCRGSRRVEGGLVGVPCADSSLGAGEGAQHPGARSRLVG